MQEASLRAPAPPPEARLDTRMPAKLASLSMTFCH
jgi:hypothetical protein